MIIDTVLKSVKRPAARSALEWLEPAQPAGPSPCNWARRRRAFVWWRLPIGRRRMANGRFGRPAFTEWSRVDSAREAETEIARGRVVLTEDPLVLTACGAIDVLVEVTGTVEPAAACGARRVRAWQACGHGQRGARFVARARFSR